MLVAYSESALKDLRALDKKVAERIVKKINFFSIQKDLFSFAKALKGLGEGRYRFRIGDYRAIFKIDRNGRIEVLMVLRIKHRREIYCD